MTEQIPSSAPAPLGEKEERQWAVIAHASVLVNLFTAYTVGTFIPLVIYFLYKDKSRFVAFHAMQAFAMQVVFGFGGFFVGVVIGGLGQLIPMVGLLCLPITCIFWLLPLAALFYGPYAAVKVNNGENFKYWFFGDFVEKNIMK
jgi:uncharacterized Tic20 family protein